MSKYRRPRMIFFSPIVHAMPRTRNVPATLGVMVSRMTRADLGSSFAVSTCARTNDPTGSSPHASFVCTL